MIFKDRIEDYTEEEFLEFLKGFSSEHSQLFGEEFIKHMDRSIEHFVKITEHPAKTDVIFYPEDDQEDSPEGILNTIKKWRAKNGKPGFKKAH
ncbi:bacteriocin immunity protein [Pseudomonas viridiflava]|uniref:bacteriocin immunity protein n=2 Tax=Pseudomonas viridiflava TaxID=33069 RepID=UPI000F040768|nr:bacteriocin immunity protein [Pseudomonas viridiflava]QXG47406.1 bacteriocin immunity protein [Pseudomonas viridiflava]